jgi:hypothetical protein
MGGSISGQASQGLRHLGAGPGKGGEQVLKCQLPAAQPVQPLAFLLLAPGSACLVAAVAATLTANIIVQKQHVLQQQACL